MRELEETLGSFFPDKIIGTDYTDVFNQYRERNFKVIAELTSIVSRESRYGLDVEETSKKINSLIFNSIQDARNKVKLSIKQKIMEYRSPDWWHPLKRPFKKLQKKRKESVSL